MKHKSKNVDGNRKEFRKMFNITEVSFLNNVEIAHLKYSDD